ncbi:GIY-YIG nuclease family protein [Breoghania sp.]|uniref:GIY-YIG nuclease family protein n=1 Tax=Breoghania sp. TaxID=2065378 RepID=UPI002AAACB5E|nr:GIY-YIG nuclease family protein [Breoghania sp.]
MSNGLPEGKRIRIRSFYGFSPEEDGYVGWTQEQARDAYLRKLNNGDLLMIYGASTSDTEKALRSYVLGFVEIETTPIRDVDKSSALGMQRKRDNGWEDRWSYGIPIRRAWRAQEKVMISRIAFNSYRSEAGQALAVHGAELDDDEIAEALKIKVREVNVFGEEPVTEDDSPVIPFADAFRPSRAFPGSAGTRTSVYEDGDTYLYLAMYDGDGHAFLGRKKAFGDRSVAVKIGITNDPKRRYAELNAGIPPAASGKWSPRLISQAFPDIESAEAVEQQFKNQSSGKLESLGGEFFWGRIEEAERLFYSLPGMVRFRSK